tara:strand:+ start:9510 stop:10727 length:1218 start_codon:yes stop_codon:yes gene_type:complete
MVKIIWDFNEFMESDFKSLSIGLTPSGHLHLGFLSTLACCLLYLKEHPKTDLIITNVENSLASDVEKYNYKPLRFQYLEKDGLIIPKNREAKKDRDLVGKRIHGELNNLIWRLIQILDTHTKEEIRVIKKSFIPPKHRKFLELKENRIYHIFNNHIYIYSFLRILEKDKSFRQNLFKLLTDLDFAKVANPLFTLNFKLTTIGQRSSTGKTSPAYSFQVLARLYCPDCFDVCPGWSKVILNDKNFRVPTIASKCENPNCPRGSGKIGQDGMIYHKMKDDIDEVEIHFMLNSLRDFFPPFSADCHVFGGDYFQILSEFTGKPQVNKIARMFEFLERKTGQQKVLFGGPLITIGGEKMAKTGTSLNLNQIKKIKPVFLNIVKKLEELRSKRFPKGIQIEYEELMKRVA